MWYSVVALKCSATYVYRVIVRWKITRTETIKSGLWSWNECLYNFRTKIDRNASEQRREPVRSKWLDTVVKATNAAYCLNGMGQCKERRGAKGREQKKKRQYRKEKKRITCFWLMRKLTVSSMSFSRIPPTHLFLWVSNKVPTVKFTKTFRAESLISCLISQSHTLQPPSFAFFLHTFIGTSFPPLIRFSKDNWVVFFFTATCWASCLCVSHRLWDSMCVPELIQI